MIKIIWYSFFVSFFHFIFNFLLFNICFLIKENICQRFEHELKGLAKFTQKKLSDSDLKFTILPLVDSKDHVIVEEAIDENKEKSIDFNNLDPNQLLSDEFEESLKKK
jgi:hypothetical protein